MNEQATDQQQARESDDCCIPYRELAARALGWQPEAAEAMGYTEASLDDYVEQHKHQVEMIVRLVQYEYRAGRADAAARIETLEKALRSIANGDCSCAAEAVLEDRKALAAPQEPAQGEHDPDECGCGNHAPWCPFNPNATEVEPYPRPHSPTRETP